MSLSASLGTFSSSVLGRAGRVVSSLALPAQIQKQLVLWRMREKCHFGIIALLRFGCFPLPPSGLRHGSCGGSHGNSPCFLPFSNQGGRGTCPPLWQPSCVDNTVCSSHLPREKLPYLLCNIFGKNTCLF